MCRCHRPPYDIDEHWHGPAGLPFDRAKGEARLTWRHGKQTSARRRIRNSRRSSPSGVAAVSIGASGTCRAQSRRPDRRYRGYRPALLDAGTVQTIRRPLVRGGHGERCLIISGVIDEHWHGRQAIDASDKAQHNMSHERSLPGPGLVEHCVHLLLNLTSPTGARCVQCLDLRRNWRSVPDPVSPQNSNGSRGTPSRSGCAR